MLSVNTNIVAMKGSQGLHRVMNSHSVSMERLSSGMKINNAKDDAAGLQISNRLHAQSRGMDVAIRNANDGISMLQTAESAMNEYTESLMRMRDLALRYANGSLSSEDRTAIQEEYITLTDELHRLADTTSFGGERLLNGTNSHKSFQVGSNGGETVSIELPNLGTKEQQSTVVEDRFVRYTEYNQGWISKDGDRIGVQRISYDEDRPHQTEDFVYVDIEAGSSVESIARQVNDELGNSVHMLTEEYTRNDGTKSQRLVYYSQFENEYVAVRHYHNSYPHNQNSPFTTGKGIYHSPSAEVTKVNVISSIPYLDNPKLAGTVAEELDELLRSVDSYRANIGATQNRLHHAINNLNQSSENVAASNRQIRDTDFAKETSELTKQSILKEVNTSMLAQASKTPQGALGLLS
ncbi:flagellin [Vibrio sp. 10N.261.52.C11]